MFLDTAECQGACDSDPKCQSYSYNSKKHDCVLSQSAIRFNPEFNYYSRQPWLHKSHIDDNDGTNYGTNLGRYNVFTGMMFPERTNFAERKFISLDKCKDLCDADAPKHTVTNERLGEFVPTKEYPKGDGCSAFAYSEETQTCLLKGLPVSYSPDYVYYSKRSFEAAGAKFNKLGPEARKKQAKLDEGIKQQKQAAEAEESNQEQGDKAEKINEEQRKVEKVEQEQAAVEKQAAEEAKQEVKAQTAKSKEAKEPKISKRRAAERKLKETTEKQLEKETKLEAQRQSDDEVAQKEKAAKVRVTRLREVSAKIRAKSAANAKNAGETRVKGNLKQLLAEFIDKAQLMANNERDLKSAISKGKEHNTKEAIVKAKVRQQRLENKAKGIEYNHEMEMAKQAAAETNAGKDAAVVAKEQEQIANTKDKVKSAKIRVKELQDENAAASTRVDETKANIAKIKEEMQKHGSGELAGELKLNEESLDQAESKVKDILDQISEHETDIKTWENELTSLTGEVSEAQAAENAAAAEAELSSQNVRYVYTGDKPAVPTNEESTLYRHFSKMVGLPIPGADKTPVPPTDSTSIEPESTGTVTSGVADL